MAQLSNLSRSSLQLAYNSLLKLKEPSINRGSGEEAYPNGWPATRDLQHAYAALLQLKQTMAYPRSEKTDADDAPEVFEEQLNIMLSLMRSKLGGPQVV